ncbi:hypothetical protein Dsin_031174 [Dipteronia sinensis]|uniref:Uncharacterized protein n=1 Tax=Dipteronia sinensis TaxID=43782 RepID=A0AAE0DRY8_9ROSI|nr:hypothetical protein Dsin_031174 [Dipteronia sinensis]
MLSLVRAFRLLLFLVLGSSLVSLNKIVAMFYSVESQKLLQMEKALQKHIIGQPEAVEAISCAIRRARVGIGDPNRPIGSFLFTGPTGVGKTELAKSLAIEYFGCKRAMIKLDMSEYMERHSVSKFFGSPPGYVDSGKGGQLTEAVRKRPHSVVLFDEIEKAHHDVLNVMLQVLDEGRLTDSKGQTVDFKNTIIIMTSNIGSDLIAKEGVLSSEQVKAEVEEELKRNFRLEFLNRFDDVIVFKQLKIPDLKDIVEIMINEVHGRLKPKNIELIVTERFKEKIIKEGYSPCYGARSLKRAVRRFLVDNLAEKILIGEFKEGDTITTDDDKQMTKKKTASTKSNSSTRPHQLPRCPIQEFGQMGYAPIQKHAMAAAAPIHRHAMAAAASHTHAFIPLVSNKVITISVSFWLGFPLFLLCFELLSSLCYLVVFAFLLGAVFGLLALACFGFALLSIKAIALKSSLMSLLTMAPTATVISSIAILRFTATEFEHFQSIDGNSVGLDVKTLKHIIGQSEAVGAVSRVIRRAVIGLQDTNGPIGSFLFAGPFGVGKTLLAKSLAMEYFGTKESIIRLNMNEYTEKDSVSLLTETVQKRPHSVILLHNIQEAHRNVLMAIIQALRDGRLTDNKGLTVHFNKIIIIMTSNSDIGYRGWFHYYGDNNSEKSKHYLEQELQWKLGMELLNSIDEVVVFKQLGVSELKEIVETMMKEVCEKLIKTENIKLTVTENFKDKLAKEAYGDEKCWSRVVRLKKAFQRLLVDNITMGILNEKVKHGAVTMDIDAFGNVHYFYPPCISVA